MGRPYYLNSSWTSSTWYAICLSVKTGETDRGGVECRTGLSTEKVRCQAAVARCRALPSWISSSPSSRPREPILSTSWVSTCTSSTESRFRFLVSAFPFSFLLSDFVGLTPSQEFERVVWSRLGFDGLLPLWSRVLRLTSRRAGRSSSSDSISMYLGFGPFVFAGGCFGVT